MRQKRVKGYRKVMQMYCSTFKFRYVRLPLLPLRQS